MKKALTAFTLCLLSILAVCAQNYPTVYLRGDMDGSGWAALDEYKFSREGDVYTLQLSSLNGSFKIADADWGPFDYGGSQKGININIGKVYALSHAGQNLSASINSEVRLSFEYNRQLAPDAQNIRLKVETDEISVAAHSGTLPILYINVYKDADHTQLEDEVISYNLAHKNYFKNAEYWLDLNGCEWLEALGAKSIGSKEQPHSMQIKARGNWTRIGFSKKPFKLKLDEKQPLLGLSKSKHFALIAHADDSRGYLKNFVGFNLGRRIGLPWTPDQQPVEVYINGDYRGLYFLTESIRIEKDRVNITELDDNVSDADLVSGGYLVELDNYDEENQIRMDEKSCVPGYYLDKLRITFDTPEEYSELQRKFVTDQFVAMNDAVGANSDDLWSYLDLDDAARYYLVEEIISHTESYHGSTYLFRDRGEDQKWHFSPLWDCGNAFSGPTDGFFYDHSPFGNTWIPSMRANSKFNEKVRETWLWFMSNAYDGIVADIDDYVAHITAAAEADYSRWAGEPHPDGGASVVDNRDMKSRRDGVVAHLADKVKWLKQQFGDFAAGSYAEPERDATPAAALPDYAQSGVENIDVDLCPDAPATYYDLNGRPVAHPAPGQIYIRRTATTSSLVRI